MDKFKSDYLSPTNKESVQELRMPGQELISKIAALVMPEFKVDYLIQRNIGGDPQDNDHLEESKGSPGEQN